MNFNILLIAGIMIIIYLVFRFLPVGLYFAARSAGLKLSFCEMLGMRIRRSPLPEIINSLIIVKKEDLKVSKDELEALALADVNINEVLEIMIRAKRSGNAISFKDASGQVLAKN